MTGFQLDTVDLNINDEIEITFKNHFHYTKFKKGSFNFMDYAFDVQSRGMIESQDWKESKTIIGKYTGMRPGVIKVYGLTHPIETSKNPNTTYIEISAGWIESIKVLNKSGGNVLDKISSELIEEKISKTAKNN